MTIRTDILEDSLSTESATVADIITGNAKAWANLNGTGTIALRESFNISSVADNGTGNYRYSCTNMMANTDYVVVGSGKQDAINQGLIAGIHDYSNAPTTSEFTVQHRNAGSTLYDTEYSMVQVMGDLA